jgi:hypothetical protein
MATSLRPQCGRTTWARLHCGSLLLDPLRLRLHLHSLVPLPRRAAASLQSPDRAKR